MVRLSAQRPEAMTSIKVPPLGESIVEATVSRWMKKEGEVVSPGDTLVELETDKITVEVPAMSRGVLTKRLHKEGDVVRVDDLLGEIDESAAPAVPKRESTMPTPPMPVQAIPSAPAAAPAPQKTAEPARAEVRASPAAERVATQQEIDMSAVEALRTRIKERIEKEHGVRLSAMSFFVKAACLALRTYPVVNAQLDGDSIVYKHYVNMGIAVASEAGLVVPSIKGADQ